MGKEQQVIQRETNTATKFYFTPVITSLYILISIVLDTTRA
jgi:hypothetical protein